MCICRWMNCVNTRMHSATIKKKWQSSFHIKIIFINVSAEYFELFFRESWKDTEIYYCIGPLLFAVRSVPRRVSTAFVFDLQPLAAYCETRNKQTTVTTTTNSDLSLLCYVPNCSILVPENGGSRFFWNAGNQVWKPTISNSNSWL